MTQLRLPEIEDGIEKFFYKFPDLPSYITQLMVVYGPYLVLIGGFFVTLNSGILDAYQIGGILPFFQHNKAFGPVYFTSLAFNLIYGLILLLAFKPLLSRQLNGWRMLFYANMISLFVSLLSGDIGMVVFHLVSFYLLYEIKKYYS